MSKVVLITGASSGFGRLTAEAIARAGHTVYGSMRHTATRNAPVAQEMEKFSQSHHVDLRALELDVQSQDSVDAAVARVIAEQGRIGLKGLQAEELVQRQAEAADHAHVQEVAARGPAEVRGVVLPGNGSRHGNNLSLWSR